jgi:hypothetical protein
MRFLLIIGLLIILCGCTSGLPFAFSTPRDQELFLRGMDELKAGQEMPEAFNTLEKSYPDSPWTERSRTLTDLVSSVKNQQASVRRLERDLSTCRQENGSLEQQKKILENGLAKLKRLLIDLEKR